MIALLGIIHLIYLPPPAWIDGVTPWVGIKAMIEDFQVDMHQRDQEMTATETLSSSSKVNRRKAFYAAEVVMKNLDLRCKLCLPDIEEC